MGSWHKLYHHLERYRKALIMQITANNICIEIDVNGPENGPAILLTRGLGTQLSEWPEAFYGQLARDGYRIIRYDNRDCGLSEKMGPCIVNGEINGEVNGKTKALTAPKTTSDLPEPAYTIFDMAADAIGILDALKIERAHLFGISMGGMISQAVAAHYPNRVISLISVMSSAGEVDPTQGSSPTVTSGLTADWPPASARDEIIAKGIADCYLYGSRTHRLSEEILRPAVTASMERCYCPGGIMRQYAGLKSSGDRQDMLRTIACPTLVIHGDEDPLIPVSSGKKAATLIPNAIFRLIKGMGHDMPGPLLPEITRYVQEHCKKAELET